MGGAIVALTLSAMSVSVAFAGPFEDAEAALKSGDYATAVRKFRALADQGNAAAQNYMGYFYATGRGAPRDLGESNRWFKKAADQGLAGAQVNLGVAYQFGHDIPVDLVEAAKWFRKAADQGSADGQNRLGSAYQHGAGVSRDLVEAIDVGRMGMARLSLSLKSRIRLQ